MNERMKAFRQEHKKTNKRAGQSSVQTIKFTRSKTYQLFAGQRRMVANDVIDGNANGEGDALLDGLAVNLLVVELGDGGIDDGGTELAKIDDLGAGEALLDQTLEGEVDDLGRLLILRADVAVGFWF